MTHAFTLMRSLLVLASVAMVSCLLPTVTNGADVTISVPDEDGQPISADVNHKIEVQFILSAGYTPMTVKLLSADGTIEFGSVQSNGITAMTDPNTGVTTCECLLPTGMVDLTDVTVKVTAFKPNPDPPYGSLIATGSRKELDIYQP